MEYFECLENGGKQENTAYPKGVVKIPLSVFSSTHEYFSIKFRTCQKMLSRRVNIYNNRWQQLNDCNTACDKGDQLTLN